MAVTVLQRHPRFSIACGVGLLVIFLLQVGGPSATRLYPPSLRNVDVAWRLKKSEDVYQESVKQVSHILP